MLAIFLLSVPEDLPWLQCPAEQTHLEEEEEEEELLLAAQLLPCLGFLWDGLGADGSW